MMFLIDTHYALSGSLSSLAAFIALVAALLKLTDMLLGGKLTELAKHWVPRAYGFLVVRNREKNLVKRRLRKHLLDDGFSDFKLRRSEVLSMMESFSVSLKSDRRAASLLPSILAVEIGRDQKLFSIASEAGGGKTVLGMLIPLLCSHYPTDGLAALYVGPTDWIKGVAPVDKVIGWLVGWPKDKRKLVIIDSFNEVAAEVSELKRLVENINKHCPHNCGFLLLYRPTTTKQGDIFAAVAAAFSEKPSKVSLHFEPGEYQQCAVFCRLFPRANVNPSQVSRALKIYSSLFPRYKLTRLSSVMVLRHLYESFFQQGELDPGNSSVRPPDDIVFDAILPRKIDLNDSRLKPLGNIGFGLVKKGHPPTFKEFRDIREDPHSRALSLAYEGSLMFEIDGVLVKRAEMALAALHIAQMIAASKGISLSPSLEEFRGKSIYDACSAFVLPAYRRIDGDRGVLYSTLTSFLKLDDAPYSFCAQIIHSNHDFLLISREASEDLSHKLFMRLIQAIDRDRRKTCRDSIRESPARPNPLLDQLFEVVSAYGDSAVQLLVDKILLPSWGDLEKSQGAYLLLDWLKRLFAASDEETRARRRHIYTILNGFEALSTENLHCRFHVVEVLDELRGRRDSHLTDLPGFLERLDQLLARYSRLPEPLSPRDESKLATVYATCNALLSHWIGALQEGQPLEGLLDRVLPQILKDFEDVVTGLGLATQDASLSISVEELERALECYEVLLGLSRRVCREHIRPPYLKFISDSESSPLWIVRWWAFYNMSQLILSLLPKSESTKTIGDCLKWMIRQIHQSGEPMGLKHRQCTTLRSTIEQGSLEIDRDVVQKTFRLHQALDEDATIEDYSAILQDVGRASNYLEEYFQRMRRFEAEFR